jgi:tungstate transport system ATP-binding protein
MTDPASILPLELRDLTFDAGGKSLVKQISCTFEQGPRTVVIGPNGAGKSLLLRLCHGLIQPTGGEVKWHGAGGRDPSRFQAMVFQRPMMLRRSVSANVEYALVVRGVPRADRGPRVEEALRHTGLRRLAAAPARVLSFGEQQKLALARAWALRPQVLFLDEPTANLDPAATHAVETTIQDIHAAGTRVIMTTHDLGQARRIADEVLFLYRGRLKEKASAETFFARPRNDLARAFLRGELLWWRKKPLKPPP